VALLLLALFGSFSAHAQLLAPFESQRGLKTAMGSAQGSLGLDAELVGVGTFGDFEYQGQSVQFSTTDGKATLWAYVFRSATSGQSKTIAVVSLGGLIFTPFDLPDSGLDVPTNALLLDSNDTYFNSGPMVGRIAGDTAYTRFRAKYPSTRPLFVTLRTYTAEDSLELPGGFPIEQPLWTLVWLGSGDSSLVCAVASKTGETYCQRVELPSSAVPGSAGVPGTAAITVSPNPAAARVRIDLDIPDGGDVADVSLLLVTVRGELVADLSSALVDAGGTSMTFDASELPAGTYFVQAVGRNWRGVAACVVNASE